MAIEKNKTLQQAEEDFQRHIGPFDELLWVGQPKQGVIWHPGNTTLYLFNFAAVSFLFFVSYPLIKEGWPFSFFEVVLICLTIMATAILLNSFLGDMLRRSKKVYAISNSLILLKTKKDYLSVETIPIYGIDEVMTEKTYIRGIKTIRFVINTSRLSFSQRVIKMDEEVKEEIVFEYIRDADKLLQQIEKTRSKNPKPPGASSYEFQ